MSFRPPRPFEIALVPLNATRQYHEASPNVGDLTIIGRDELAVRFHPNELLHAR